MKLPQISGKELIKKLQHAGFIATRQRGSHIRLEKRSGDKLIKITIPLHGELKKGTLNRILKDSGVLVEDLDNL